MAPRRSAREDLAEHLTRDLQSIKRHVLGMAGLAEEALGLALSAYARREEVPALRLARAERHFDILIARMKRDSGSVEPAVALLSVSRGVERIAALVTNIAEDVVYVVEAHDIRHPTPQRQGSGID